METANSKGPTFGIRHVQIMYAFLLSVIAYAMRVNISIAIIAMTTKRSSNPDIPIYDWDNKSVVLSSFFWAYVVLQIAAAPLGRKYGTRNVLLIIALIDSTASILIPLMAEKFGSYGVMGCRLVEGLAQGFVYPSIANILGQWAPPSERSFLSTITYSGGYIGVIIISPISGFICSSWLGWPVTFYLLGAIGYAWVLSYYFFGADSPADHKRITDKEKLYIESSLAVNEHAKKLPIPWRSICTSLPVWAIIVAHLGSSWGLALIVTQLPTYLDKIMQLDLNSNGLLSAAPYLVCVICSFIVAYFVDYIINNCKAPRGCVRKACTAIAFVGSSLCFIILSYMPKSAIVTAIALIIISEGVGAFQVVGLLINHIDLSPNFCGIVMGIANCLGSIASIIAPLTVQFLVTDETDQTQWRLIFIISAVIRVISAIFYVVFASGKVQSWNFSTAGENPVENGIDNMAFKENYVHNKQKEDKK